MELRTFINLEKASMITVLDLIAEVEQSRDLRATEKFLRIIFQDALDKLEKGM